MTVKLQYDNKTDIPDTDTGDSVEFKEGGKVVWLHTDLAESRRQTFRMKGDLTTNTETSNTLKAKLDKLEAAEAERQKQEQIKQDAERLKSGQHQNVIDDLRGQLDAKDADHAKVKQEWELGKAKDRKESIVVGLAGTASKGNGDLLRLALERDIQVNPEGAVVIVKDGKTSGVTLEQYTAQLTELYPQLVAAVQSSGGSAMGGAGSANNGNKGDGSLKINDPQLADRFSKLPVK